jgi:uncharacterized membrane protein (UPF0182 family)
MAEEYSRNGDDNDSLTPEVGLRPSGSSFKWGAVIIGLIVLFGIVSFGRGIYTDLLWYESLDLRSIFIKVAVTRITLFAIGAAIAAIVLSASFRVAYLHTKGQVTLPLPGDVSNFVSRIVVWGSIVVALLLSLIFGSVLSAQWELFLRFANAASFGQTDPVYGQDLSFYIFNLPIYSFIQGWVMGLGIVTLIGTIALHFINYTLRGASYEFTGRVIIHLSVIGAALMLTIAAGHWFDRLALVLSEDGAVFGAAYADLSARRPAMLIMTIVAVAAAIMMLANIYFRGLRIVVGSVVLWIVLGLVLTTAWPALIQQFSVTPNEFVREQPYIARNIEFTRQAFALNRIEEQFYPAESEVGADLIRDNLKTVNNIRLWDYRPLSDVYRQIQLIRLYYDFKDADVDRYTIAGEYRQVLLSAREVAPENLEIESQNWVNNTLVYTHGIGIAMSPVTEFTPEGRPEFFAQDIPTDGAIPIGLQDGSTPPDLIVDNPRIYYGENTLNYVIVNSNTDELDYQTAEGDLFRTKYGGIGGVKLSSIFRRLAYAWQFGDFNILISGEIIPESRIQYHRAIQERVAKATPFLVLDRDPYIVAAEGQLFWVQDAYTTSDHYPYSDPIDDPTTGQINYMRNSVKAVIDAYDGSLNYYIWDETDPIVRTYARIFPELFKSKDEMPEGLKSHVRYPQDFFSVQAEKYLKYHMQVPENFYNNEDLWAIPNEKFGPESTVQEVEPYYVIMRLPDQQEPDQQEEEFVLLMPYTPSQRQNLVGWLAARSDGENYGKLVAFNFPKDRQIDGPEQVEARIDNDQDISAWFTLRCSEGSTCTRGNLLVIPVGNSLLYAEPVYIRAEGVNFPELKRVILATGHKVVMEDSLGLALAALTGDDSLATMGEPKPARAEDTSVTVTEPGNEFEQQIQVLVDTIENMKLDLDSLGEAIERLKELTGGE